MSGKEEHTSVFQNSQILLQPRVVHFLGEMSKHRAAMCGVKEFPFKWQRRKQFVQLKTYLRDRRRAPANSNGIVVTGKNLCSVVPNQTLERAYNSSDPQPHSSIFAPERSRFAFRKENNTSLSIAITLIGMAVDTAGLQNTWLFPSLRGVLPHLIFQHIRWIATLKRIGS